MDYMNLFISSLNNIESISLRFHRKVTDEMLGQFVHLTKLFENLTDLEKDNARALLTDKLRWKLLGFSEYAAERAIETKEESWLKSALLAHIIENSQIDIRENMLSLSVIVHAANKLHVNLGKMFEEIVGESNQTTIQREFYKFICSQPNLRVFGLEEIQINGRTKFVPIKL